MLKYFALVLLFISLTSCVLAHKHDPPVVEGSLFNTGVLFYIFVPGVLDRVETDGITTCSYVSNFSQPRTGLVHNKYECSANQTLSINIDTKIDSPLFITALNYSNIGLYPDYLVSYLYPFMGYTYYTTVNFFCPSSDHSYKFGTTHCIMKLNSTPLGPPSGSLTNVILALELSYSVN